MGFTMSVDSVQADRSKISAIIEWPTSKNIHYVHSFYGLAFFYKKNHHEFQFPYRTHYRVSK
jgi:hypothetical protein